MSTNSVINIATIYSDHLWGDSPLVTKRRTVPITRHIKKAFVAVTALTPAFHSTPEVMMQSTTRHPMLLELDGFYVSPFGRALQANDPAAFRVARAKQKKLGAQLAGHADGAKAI